MTNDEELIFETCFIIGDSALARRLPDIAITWLQRAKDHLETLSIKTLEKTPDYHNWNLVIRHSLGEWVDLVNDLGLTCCSCGLCTSQKPPGNCHLRC